MVGKPLNIVFMGNPDFAVPSLERIVGSVHNMVAVVTGTDKRRGRGAGRDSSPVKKSALKASIPVIEADQVNSPDFLEVLKEFHPDLLVVVAYKLLPAEVLAIPKIGSVNLHASLLPKYRGAAPIHWALINGEKETGCTVFLLNEGMDTGRILKQQRIPVHLLDTTGDLYERLKWMGADLLLNAIDDISSGHHSGTEQGNKNASKAPRITLGDARVNFQEDCLTVHNLIRGMSPTPGAWTHFEGKMIKLFRSRPDNSQKLSPGHVQAFENKCYAGCMSGCVELVEVQPEGKKIMSGMDFINGTKGKVYFT